MVRPLRIEYPDAWYHVMNRGRRGEQIFLEEKDHQRFLELLKESLELWNLRIAAYCMRIGCATLRAHTGLAYHDQHLFPFITDNRTALGRHVQPAVRGHQAVKGRQIIQFLLRQLLAVPPREDLQDAAMLRVRSKINSHVRISASGHF